MGGVWFDGSKLSQIIMGIKVILDSGSRRYEISAPCIFSNTQCLRINQVIQGYDVPLIVEKGIYDISLIISWSVEGKGDFKIQLNLEGM